MALTYAEFLATKRRVVASHGVSATEVHPRLFPWQAAICRWAARKGRAAIFADCGLGKSFMQIAWARALGCPTLFFAPLCVAEQTVSEAAKLDVELVYAGDQSQAGEAPLVITNYERLDRFDMSRYPAVVLDESSILKAFDGATRNALIRACAETPYRLCCTATPSPNDIAELANHAEFLGLITRPEFLATWFIKIDQGQRTTEHHGWRLKGHAREPFFRWLASWAIALRRPSDIGYSDDGFELPPLTIRDRVVQCDQPVAGALFPEAGLKGIQGRLSVRRASLEDRVRATSELVAAEPDEPWLLWCGLNDESHAIARAIPGAVEVTGADNYADKSAAVRGFCDGSIRVLVSKTEILGFGLNFQHCARTAFVGLSDSYEKYYQAIRRVWRFGQTRPVEVWIVVSEPERLIVDNVRRKEAAAATLADGLLTRMRDFEREELAS